VGHDEFEDAAEFARSVQIVVCPDEGPIDQRV